MDNEFKKEIDSIKTNDKSGFGGFVPPFFKYSNRNHAPQEIVSKIKLIAYILERASEYLINYRLIMPYMFMKEVK